METTDTTVVEPRPLANDLARSLATGAATTAGTIAVMALVGFARTKLEERKARKSAETPAE